MENTEKKSEYRIGDMKPDEIVVSVLDTDENGVTIKLWPKAVAVRRHLDEVCAGGNVDAYSLRHYYCGRAMYCAVELDDLTRDAPCPAAYKVNADSNLNESDGSLVAAAAEWQIGSGVFLMRPLRLSNDRVQINPVAGRDGKTIHHYELAERLTVADIRYNEDGTVASMQLRKASDGSVISWPKT